MSEQPANTDHEDRLCVPFREAVWWITCRNFAGRSIGPIRLSERPIDEDDFEDWAIGRYHFAMELLLDYATRSRIRIYSWKPYVSNGAPTQSLDHRDAGFGMVIVSPTFIAKAAYTDSEDEDGEPSLSWSDDDEEVGYTYTGLFVDHGDLTEQFWGDVERRQQPATREKSSPIVEPLAPDQQLPLRPLTKRGRRAKHKWAEFVAAAVACCLNGPIRTKTELTDYMKNWCAEHWRELPDDTQITGYVSAIFESFRAHWSKSDAAAKQENSGPRAENSTRGAAD